MIKVFSALNETMQLVANGIQGRADWATCSLLLRLRNSKMCGRNEHLARESKELFQHNPDEEETKKMMKL
jgi:hypothetical protein